MLILNNEKTLEVVSDNYKKIFQSWISHSKTDADILRLAEVSYLGTDVKTLINVFCILVADWFVFRKQPYKAQHIKQELNEGISDQNVLYLLNVLKESNGRLKSDLYEQLDRKSVLNSVLLAKNWVFKEHLFKL